MFERNRRYDRVAQMLHWLTVALIAAQFAVAWTMPDIHRGTPPIGLVAWHLSIGTVILLVVSVRLFWRLTHPAPPAPATLPPMLRLVSRLTHLSLYVVLVVLPLLGWANASSRGWSVRLFGIIPLPPLATTGSAIGHAMGDVHQTVAIVLLVLIGAHVAGALYHGVILRDETLGRMVSAQRQGAGA